MYKKVAVRFKNSFLSIILSLALFCCDPAGPAGWVDNDNDGFDDNTQLDNDGYNRDGFKDGYDRDGYNAAGFNANDFDRDGYNAAGFNANGFDRDGYNAAGFNANGFDRDGYNANGYNANGLDRDGWEYVAPVNKVAPSPDSEHMSTQPLVYSYMGLWRNALNSQATNIADRFNNLKNPNQCPDAIKNAVVGACEQMRTRQSTRDEATSLVADGLTGVHLYIVAIESQLSPEKREKFMLLQNAFRAKAYLDFRAHGDHGAAHGEELQGLYNQLQSMGIDINDIETILINGVSQDANMNPELVKMLLNQMTSQEQLFSLKDDAFAQGFKPTLNSIAAGQFSTNNFRWRSMAYVTQNLLDARQNLNQN